MSKHKDPTQTLTIRERAISSINRRFNTIKSLIRQTIVDNGVMSNAEPASPTRFAFLYDADKVDEFAIWLKAAVAEELLQGGSRGNWLTTFVGYSYERGARKAASAINRNKQNISQFGNASPLTIPEHIQRSELLFTRTYKQLKGVTEVMESQIASVLSDGIIKGHGVRQIATAMLDRVEKIGKTRARLIARTEIVNAHNVASITESDRLARELDEPIEMLWLTALDGRERPSHRARHKKVYTRKVAAGLIGEPNCRCSISPYIVNKK